jgi:hypothetical protein
VKFIDPDGNYLINNIAGNVVGNDGVTYSARDYATNIPSNWLRPFANIGTVLGKDDNGFIAPRPVSRDDIENIEFENNLNNKLRTVENINITESRTTTATVTATAKKMNNGLYQIDLTINISTIDPSTGEINIDTTSGTIAFASPFELLETSFGVNKNQVNNIANQVLEITNFNARVDE